MKNVVINIPVCLNEFFQDSQETTKFSLTTNSKGKLIATVHGWHPSKPTGAKYTLEKIMEFPAGREGTLSGAIYHCKYRTYFLLLHDTPARLLYTRIKFGSSKLDRPIFN